jgi:hypothetical protein
MPQSPRESSDDPEINYLLYLRKNSTEHILQPTQLSTEQSIPVAGAADAGKRAMALFDPDLLVQLPSPSYTRQQTPPFRPAVNAVIIILFHQSTVGKMETSLRLLQENLLRCFSYPLHLFVEHTVSPAQLRGLEMLVPNALSVTFEKVCFDDCAPARSPGVLRIRDWLKARNIFYKFCLVKVNCVTVSVIHIVNIT